MPGIRLAATAMTGVTPVRIVDRRVHCDAQAAVNSLAYSWLDFKNVDKDFSRLQTCYVIAGILSPILFRHRYQYRRYLWLKISVFYILCIFHSTAD